LNIPVRGVGGDSEASVQALCGFYRRMLVTIAREMDEAPDPWVREAIGDWLDEFVRESTSWSNPPALRSVPPLSLGGAEVRRLPG
jgi:hypothetical protein